MRDDIDKLRNQNLQLSNKINDLCNEIEEISKSQTVVNSKCDNCEDLLARLVLAGAEIESLRIFD